MIPIAATADQPGKTVYATPTEGGVFVLLYITSPSLRDLGGEYVQLTPDEARTLAQGLEDAADAADVEVAG